MSLYRIQSDSLLCNNCSYFPIVNKGIIEPFTVPVALPPETPPSPLLLPVTASRYLTNQQEQ